jgi:shikimate kinase
MNIALIGFMGTGKTSVGKILSKKLNRTLYEIDEIIEKKERKTINKIFNECGESKFRIIESNVLNEIIKESKESIISCGGGIILAENNITELKKNCFNILLTASPEVILKRINKNKSRPLLKFDNKLDRIKYLLNERKELYEKTANLIINTDKIKPSEIANIIIERIEVEK